MGEILEADRKNPSYPSRTPIISDLLRERFRKNEQNTPPNHQYGELIRERLKMILNRQRKAAPFTAPASEDLEAEDFAHPSFYRPSRYYYPPHSHNHHYQGSRLDPNQVYTRDMMASMATIMSAVGDILVKKGNGEYWKKMKKRSHSAPPDQIPHHPQEQQQLSSSSDYQIQPGSRKEGEATLSKAGSSDFMKEMAEALFNNNNNNNPANKPRSKSVIVDQILQKLQVS